MTEIIRRIVQAGGARLARKAVKSVPVIGTAIAVGLAGYEIKKKGLFKGTLNFALDAIPVAGTAKNAIELFTGDWFPDRQQKQ